MKPLLRTMVVQIVVNHPNMADIKRNIETSEKTSVVEFQWARYLRKRALPCFDDTSELTRIVF